MTTSGDPGQGAGRNASPWTRLTVTPVEAADVEELRAAMGRLPAITELSVRQQESGRVTFEVAATSLGRLLYELEQVASKVGGVVTRTIAGEVVLALPSGIEPSGESAPAGGGESGGAAPRPSPPQLSIIRPSGWSPVDSAIDALNAHYPEHGSKGDDATRRPGHRRWPLPRALAPRRPSRTALSSSRPAVLSWTSAHVRRRGYSLRGLGIAAVLAAGITLALTLSDRCGASSVAGAASPPPQGQATVGR